MFSTYSRQVDTAQWTSKLFNRGTYKSVKHRKKRVKIAKSQAAKGHKKNQSGIFFTPGKDDTIFFYTCPLAIFVP